MPYIGVSDPDLPPSVKGLPKRLQEIWVRVFNEEFDPKDEGKAFRSAWSAIRRASAHTKERKMELISKAKKTEGGEEYGSNAFLVVPDPEKPSEWKLRIEEAPGKVTVAQLGRAAAALGPGFRGQKVQLDDADRKAAAKKLIGMYRGHDVADEDVPEYLWDMAGMKAKEDSHRGTPRSQTPGRDPGENTEDRQTEGGSTALALQSEKAVALGELESAVFGAFLDQFNPPHGEGPMEYVQPGFRVQMVMPEFLIAFKFDEEGEAYWKVPYTVATVPVEGDPLEQEVIEKVEFAPFEQWVRVIPTFVEFKAFDTAAGKRWLMVSSGGFEDRDREIVSTEFLEYAVKAADGDGSRGPLLIWHVPGSDIGACDTQVVVGKPGFLLESGLFSDTPAGQAAGQYFSQNAKEYGGSIQFVYARRTEDGVYLPPGRIIERSVLPSDRAAFPWSAVALKEVGKMPITKEKQAELEKILGVDEAARIIGQLEQGAKELQELGLRWKEVDAETRGRGDAGTVTGEPGTVSKEAPAQEETQLGPLPAVPAQMEIVLGPEVLGELAGVVTPAVQKEIASAMQPVTDGLKTLRAAVQRIAEQVELLARADKDKISDAVRSLPRATVKAIGTGQVFRPTAQTPEEAPAADPHQKDLQEIGLKSLGLKE